MITDEEKAKLRFELANANAQSIGRAPLDIDREQVVADRCSGMSLTQVAWKYRISRASVVRFVKEAKNRQEVVAA